MTGPRRPGSMSMADAISGSSADTHDSLVDFVPGVEPYEFATVVELAPIGDRTRVTMTMEHLHDQVWTERLIAGRENELANLANLTPKNS
jgi:hypothetical protein